MDVIWESIRKMKGAKEMDFFSDGYTRTRR